MIRFVSRPRNSKKYKKWRYFVKRQKRALNQIRRWNKYIKDKNSRWLGIPLASKKKALALEQFEKPNYTVSAGARKFSEYQYVTAPDHLSFKDNPEDFIGFINILKQAHTSRLKVFVELKHVKIIDLDAIVTLLAIMVRFKSEGIAFNGDIPLNSKARSILFDSGFFNELEKTFHEKDEYVIAARKRVICTHALELVDPVRTAKLIEDAAQFIWKSRRRCQGVQRTLIELMHNTTDHAHPNSSKGQRHWWLSVYHDVKQKKVSFAFIDFGIGVFKSLHNKPLSAKFGDWISKLSGTPYENDSDLFRLILNGDFHATVTGKPFRGKGLPGIKEAMDRNQLAELHVITNNVYADVAKDEYKMLNNHFDGTFVYWELNETNRSVVDIL